ncbi:hypothetical protein DCAR_0209446 [Daucus carota subsp. sativus]|uniref:Uncharacterized protein n=1 Tax=Daucus carota subsp. sativus TaxID=79200 RepID=A0A161XJU9_DAUCS|nr:PREDICTED: uncharacterized protein LOC108208234 [Daucus carota subsp. sativus]WOG90203.1 hypothetical protein DCAR_0209446 [Daucus carota subsp. sativus]
MPATFHQGSFLNRISMRRNQVVSMTDNNIKIPEFDRFQNIVAENFAGIVPGEDGDDAVLSVAWFRKLLDVFLRCEREFKDVVLLSRDPVELGKAPMDRVLGEYLDRVVKALDICNAVTHAVDLVRHWQQLAEIGVEALKQGPIGGGQVRRAKKALNSLLTSMSFDDKEDFSAKSADRTWSFGRRATAETAVVRARNRSSFRSLSFPFANSWSSAKQVQLMSANLVVPRGSDAGGLGLPVYVMSMVMTFTMWALVAAFPCQDRIGLPAQLSIGKQMVWAEPILMMHEKIGDEMKKKDKKMMNCGLLEESLGLSKLAVFLVEYDFSTVAEDQMAANIAELAEICRKMDKGLGTLEQELREVFHKLAKSRIEVLNHIDQICNLST